MDFSYDNRFDDSCSNLSVYNVPAPFHIIRMGNNMFSPERLGEEQEKQKKKKKEKERLVLKMRRQGGERENSYDSIERLVYKKRQNGDVVIVVAVVMGSMDK